MEVIFTGNDVVINGELWQFDTGQTLCISGLDDINAETEVHFNSYSEQGAIVKSGIYDDENNILTVNIPDVFLENVVSP